MKIKPWHLIAAGLALLVWFKLRGSSNLTDAQQARVNSLNATYGTGAIRQTDSASIYYTASGLNGPFTVIISADGYVNGSLPTPYQS